MRKLYICMLGLIALKLLNGCASTAKNLPCGFEGKGPISVTTFGNKQYFYKVNQWIRDSEEKLKVYIGKTKDDLRKDFGNPTYVLHDLVLLGKSYSEEWRYDYSDGIPFITDSTWSYFFYMNNGIVEYIEAF